MPVATTAKSAKYWKNEVHVAWLFADLANHMDIAKFSVDIYTHISAFEIY